jgi:hypothetical protein
MTRTGGLTVAADPAETAFRAIFALTGRLLTSGEEDILRRLYDRGRGDGWAEYLDDGELTYLASLVAADIRKRMKSVTGFAPRDGQEQSEADAILARFERNIAWRREVLGKLADVTGNPAHWRNAAAAELDLDNDDDQEQEQETR